MKKERALAMSGMGFELEVVYPVVILLRQTWDTNCVGRASHSPSLPTAYAAVQLRR